MVNEIAWRQLKEELDRLNVTLVAVSKTKPVEDILTLYELGQRDFGENYVQELVAKQPSLPEDVKWHYIGHLQSNKVKLIASFVHLIHAVDSLKLLEEINRQGAKHGRVIDVLLQMHIADEDTKFGLAAEEIESICTSVQRNKDAFDHVRICGLMGMASFTDDEQKIASEFRSLRETFLSIQQHYFGDLTHFKQCSMGMSSDYKIAINEGSSMVRVGSLLFGSRN
ncbi:MAG: YggS family pyridoxal phosphate-dependent enzyme [Sphingobacteriales bacterium]|nr:MAG: YggS family pyridoxal phosphate-dependent enzyme [Sphingobacteriales bacterium]